MSEENNMYLLVSEAMQRVKKYYYLRYYGGFMVQCSYND